MKLEGIASQDGQVVVTEATGLQIIHFIHTHLDRSKTTGYELRALPNMESLGVFISLDGALMARDKIVSKIKKFGKSAFVLVPEDKEALRLEREEWWN